MSASNSIPQRQRLDQEQADLVRSHLSELNASRTFSGSKRAQDFLRFVVGHALVGEIDSLRERVIGAELFGRPVDYDTGNDSVVRVTAVEVRRRLERYYRDTAGDPTVKIELPPGHYVPNFLFEPQTTPVQFEAGANQSPLAHPLIDADPVASRESPHEMGQPHRSPWKRWSKSSFLGFALSFSIVLASIAAYWGFDLYRASHARSTIRSIAILPFENLSGNPQHEYFSDGITDELISDLGQVPGLSVISRTSAITYKGSTKGLPEIARELSVDGVVEGTVLNQGDQVRVTVRLIDARSDRPVWEDSYMRGISNIFDLQRELSQTIAQEVSRSLTPQAQANFAQARAVSSKAQDLYMRGMLAVNTNDSEDAFRYLSESISQGPGFAAPHAALASLYGEMAGIGMFNESETFAKEKVEAIKATELDNSLPESHAELAKVRMNIDWDWGPAEKEFRSALELNPSSAPVHESFASLLVRDGRIKEAIAESERGLELDPLGARSFYLTGEIYYYARQYDRALELGEQAEALILKSTLALNHDYDTRQVINDGEVLESNRASGGSYLLGSIYLEKGMYQKAIEELMKLSRDSPHHLGRLGVAYVRAGQVDMARKVISQLEKHVQKDGTGGYDIATVYAAMGQENEAFRWLEQGYQKHSTYWLTYLKVDPLLDPLRNDPRFNDLVRRIGLPL